MAQTEIPVFGNTLAYEKINADGTVKTLTSANYRNVGRIDARAALVTIDGDAAEPDGIRWTTDGTDPVATTTGHFQPAASALVIRGFSNIARFKFTRESGNSIDIHITYFN